MHCQRQRQRDRGIATTRQVRRFILGEIRWVIQNCQVTRVNRETDQAMRRVAIAPRTFHHQNLQHATQFTIAKHRRRLKVSADSGTSATHAS